MLTNFLWILKNTVGYTVLKKNHLFLSHSFMAYIFQMKLNLNFLICKRKQEYQSHKRNTHAHQETELSQILPEDDQ